MVSSKPNEKNRKRKKLDSQMMSINSHYDYIPEIENNSPIDIMHDLYKYVNTFNHNDKASYSNIIDYIKKMHTDGSFSHLNGNIEKIVNTILINDLPRSVVKFMNEPW